MGYWGFQEGVVGVSFSVMNDMTPCVIITYMRSEGVLYGGGQKMWTDSMVGEGVWRAWHESMVRRCG